MYSRRVQKEFTAHWPLRPMYREVLEKSPGKGYRRRVAPPGRIEALTRAPTQISGTCGKLLEVISASLEQVPQQRGDTNADTDGPPQDGGFAGCLFNRDLTRCGCLCRQFVI